MKPETKALIETVLGSVRELLDTRLAAFQKRVEEVEARPIPSPAKTVYELAKDAGFQGTEADWLLSLKGEAGRDGRDGRDGYNGRDAVEIDIARGIDVGRSYPPGVYMSHDGGLLKSMRHTDPLSQAGDVVEAGWQVIVAGVKELSIELLEDSRTVRATFELTGKTLVHDVVIPSIIDRGVYKSTEQYDAGDAVSFGGSMWLSQKNGNTSKPGDGDNAWRLAVKRGRDGKDGKDGLRGERGIEGPRGKDLTQMDFSGRKW